MRSHLVTIFVCALGVLCLLAPGVQAAAKESAPPPRATLVSVEGAATTYHVEGMYGQTVTVNVPSHAMADVKLSNKDQGTVQATVVSLNGATHRVKVHTHEGQTLVLTMAPETLARLRIGEQFTLAVPRRLG
jgi:hypothetical protein